MTEDEDHVIDMSEFQNRFNKIESIIEDADYGIPIKRLSPASYDKLIAHEANLTCGYESGRMVSVEYKVLGMDDHYIYIKVIGEKDVEGKVNV